MEDSNPNKRTALAIKKLNKFQEDVHRCQQHLLAHQLTEAATILQELMKQQHFLSLHEFKGEGSIENWRYLYPKGPLQWFQQCLENKQIQDNPFDLLNICYMIQIQEKQVTVQDCLKKYLLLQSTLGDKAQLHFGMGNILYQNEEYFEAEKYYLRSLAKLPNCQKLQEALAWVQFMLEKRQQALKYCLQCLEINPQNLSALFLKILSFQSKGFNKVPQLERLLVKHPNFYRIYIELGDLVEDHEKAIETFQQALEFQPNSAYLLAKKGEEYLYSAWKSSEAVREQKMRKCKQCAEKAMNAQQQSPEAYFLTARICIEENKLEQAINFSKIGLEKFPYNFNLYQKLAEIQSTLQNWPAAVLNYKKSIELNPYNVDAYNQLAEILYNQGDRSEAIQYYQKSLQVNPQNYMAYKNLAERQIKNKRYVKALEFYTRANQIKPQETDSQYGLAICYFKLSCWEEAEKWAYRCIHSGQQTDNHNLYELMGLIQSKLQHYERALQWLISSNNMKKSINSTSIKNNLMKKLDLALAQRIVESVATRTPKNRQNIYAIMILGDLFSYLCMGKESKRIFQLAALIHNSQFVNDEIEWSLRRFKQKI